MMRARSSEVVDIPADTDTRIDGGSTGADDDGTRANARTWGGVARVRGVCDTARVGTSDRLCERDALHGADRRTFELSDHIVVFTMRSAYVAVLPLTSPAMAIAAEAGLRLSSQIRRSLLPSHLGKYQGYPTANVLAPDTRRSTFVAWRPSVRHPSIGITDNVVKLPIRDPLIVRNSRVDRSDVGERVSGVEAVLGTESSRSPAGLGDACRRGSRR